MGCKQRIAKTLPANWDVGVVQDIWECRLQKQHWMWSKRKEYELRRRQLSTSIEAVSEAVSEVRSKLRDMAMIYVHHGGTGPQKKQNNSAFKCVRVHDAAVRF